MAGMLGLPLLAQSLSQPASEQPAQNSNTSSSSSSNSGQPTEMQTAAPAQKAPAVLDSAGPLTSVTTSESLFDVMAGLNACGYNEGLAVSDPIRQTVRDEMNQALEKSESARQSRDKLCEFIHSHSMQSVRLNLASYISLALFLTPPPELTPNVATADLPPDAAPLVGVLPLLRDFSRAIDLHLIWALNHSAYDAEVVKAHVPVSKMLIQMDLYLKQPPATYGDRRFAVILEPLIAPGEMNARVYGGDYIVVESPVNGVIDLKPVKHTYLRFTLEPLIYARSESINKLTPILELVQPSPLSYQYKSDILSLVTECMLRAIEARTMDTGVPVYKVPAHLDRNQLAAANAAENAYEHKVGAIRRQQVHDDMVQGFILTDYFYQQFELFEHNSTSLREAVGEMVYGMNVDIEKRRVQDIAFAAPKNPDAVQQTSATGAMLDEGEKKLVAGDAAGAATLAQKALDAHTEYPGRAEFLLARADILSGKMEAAHQAFTQAAQAAHDLRTIAWSHIYLGRLADLQGNRDTAVAEYQAAMKTRDGRPDTTEAAEAGLKAPFAPPHSDSSSSSDPSDQAPEQH